MREYFGLSDWELSALTTNEFICGVDEVGRGCLAGPIVAGAVVLDVAKYLQLKPEDRLLIRDSKTLSRKQREKAMAFIRAIAVSYSTGSATAQEIETNGLNAANFTSMQRAIGNLNLNSKLDLVLVDGKQCIPNLKTPQQAVIGGDQRCLAIAAASILAKITRDNYMTGLHERYPEYSFSSNVGYGTKDHLEALKTYGITPEHRKNFKPVRLATHA